MTYNDLHQIGLALSALIVAILMLQISAIIKAHNAR